MSISLTKLKQVPINHVVKAIGAEANHCLMVRCPKPSHKKNDRTPSLRLFLETNSWYCFPCGLGGSVIDLVMHFTNCDFKSSLNYLEKQL
jgi:DNA primase